MQVYLTVGHSEPKALDAAIESDADWLVIDGEGLALAALSQATAPPKYLVRIDPIETVSEGRLGAIVAARPDAIMLDAVHGSDLAHLGARLAVHEAELGMPDGAIGVVALVARPQAVLQAASFINTSERLCAIGWDASLLMQALSAEDGFRDGEWCGPLGQVRALVRLAAAAARVAAIDAACASDVGEVSTAAIKAARRDGFTGMFVRDPAQVASVRSGKRGAAERSGIGRK